MSEMLLEVESVSKSFGGLKALQEVSFQVGSGEVMALIGPNGAGKSTLLNIINGFLRPSAGRIRSERKRRHPGTRSQNRAAWRGADLPEDSGLQGTQRA